MAFVYGTGLVNGTSADLLSPNAIVTREAIVVLLGRMEELMGFSLGSATTTPFTDVKTSEYYAKYVAWAYKAGLINGVSSTQFGVGQPMSWEDFCVIIDRYSTYRGITIKNLGGRDTFNDSSSISSYALASVKTCARGKLVQGYTDNTFQPQRSLLRCEAALLISEYVALHANAQ